MRPVGIDPMREPLCSALVGVRARQILTAVKPDAVFVLGASHIAGALADSYPVFHCSDATFASMVDYHGEFSTLSKRTLDAGNALERKVLQRSVAAILASERAAESARVDYMRTDGVHVVPFGANLDQLPVADVWQPHQECTLVFIGVQWYSKGADVAVETTRLLNARGIPAVLHVVGCQPPPEVQPQPFVRYHGFLRKGVPEEYAKLTQLVASSDFLIVPTRFEAYGIVFCEAAAYGTPAVSRRTGGVPTIIQDGVTGILEPVDAGPDAYAGRIEEIWSSPQRYSEMRRNAFARSRSTLNWDAWGNRVESIVRGTSPKAN
jgi:glycosyltransferase involved in cell wall biosynthesis